MLHQTPPPPCSIQLILWDNCFDNLADPLLSIVYSTGISSDWSSPEKTRACEESILSLREEYEDQVKQLQSQIRTVRSEKQNALSEVSRYRSNLSSVSAELQSKN